MEFYRNAERDLAQWRHSPFRKPLMLRGARRTGKTTLIRKFGRSFDTFISLSLETEQDRRLFENELPVQDLTQYICLEKGVQRQGETLLFLDEIQCSPRAVLLLRYFYEELPDLYVVCAESLPEVLGEKHRISFPVGRVVYLYLFPMCFEEFLMALGEETALSLYRQTPVPALAHHKLSQLFRLYSFIGGMPEAVSRYGETRDISQLPPVYSGILAAHKEDVCKYASTAHEDAVIRHVMEAAPKESNCPVTFAKFGNSTFRSADVGSAMRKLERAMLLCLRYPTTQYQLPIAPDKRLHPRLQVLDSGLLACSFGIQAQYFQDINLSDVCHGILAEQAVFQELLCQSSRERNVPVFWAKEKKQSKAEISFVVPWQGRMIPVAVKPGKDGTLRSLHQFIETAGEPFAVRLQDQPYSLLKTHTPKRGNTPGHPYRLLNLPLYCAGKIPAYLELLCRQ